MVVRRPPSIEPNRRAGYAWVFARHPFVPNHGRAENVVTVATGSGYWLENAPRLRWRAWWLWYVVTPIALRLFGYFPGKRLRKVGDLPRGVMAQWRRWCLHPHYAVGAEGENARRLYAAVTLPIVSLSFTDDEFMSARNTESIHRTVRRGAGEHEAHRAGGDR